MKLKKNYLQIAIFILVTALFGCQFNTEVESIKTEGNTIESLSIPVNFDYATSKEVNILIKNTEQNSNVFFDILDAEKNLLSSGSVKPGSNYETKISIPTSHDSLWIVSKTIGFASNGIEVLSNQANYTFSKPIVDESLAIINQSNRRTTSDYQSIGNWDSQGRPDYLITPDVIPQQLLDDINASLPENRPVPTYNPEYLTDNNMNTELSEEADIWVTFVHEGAGWKNALGYYTYDINNPPSTASEIGNLYIIFPNVSYSGSGGNLSSGDKVFLGTFPSNTGIGWFLVPNGWQAAFGTVGSSSQIKYSVKDFNTFTAPDYRQHTVLLRDDERELLLLGMEDTSRPGGDNDFNDAIFYLTANPYTAIITENFQEITNSEDTDSDGVLNHNDEYPEDGTKAFNKYIPTKNLKGSLAYEDLWPSKGDYDFNDLVIDYHYTEVLSASNQVQNIEAEFTLQAIGGYYHNGFGISLPFSSTAVESVSGNNIQGRYADIQSNGTESGHDNTVVIIFEDAYDVMPRPQGATLVNVKTNEPYVDPVTLNVSIDLTDNAINDNEFTESVISPFLIVNQDRSHEIHLPGKNPTALMNNAVFGSDADDSNPNQNRYFLTQNQLPWAILLPRKFEYPKENIEITEAHSNFSTWAETGGSMFNDWYLDRQGYRSESLIYKK